MRLIFSLILLLSVAYSHAQISAYSTVRQEFYVFEDGMKNKIEGLNPIEYQIGRKTLAYLDNARNFKIYRDGQVTKINDLFTTQFEVSDHLVLYRTANSISVIDGNNVVPLSRLSNQYGLGDSLVLFYDMNRSNLNSYYKGEIKELENFLLTNDDDFSFDKPEYVKVSDNIGAYINFNDVFKIFYNNELEILENQKVSSFKIGRNTLAYVDINNQFRIYHKGELYEIDGFAPLSYQVGDDIVAFVGYDGYFKIFHNGRLHNIGYYEPKYQVADRIVAFENVNGFFHVFYEGENTPLENYYPEDLLLGYHSLAYINRNNVLRFYSRGKLHDVTTMTINDMRLDYDVLQYKLGFNAFKFCLDGEKY